MQPSLTVLITGSRNAEQHEASAKLDYQFSLLADYAKQHSMRVFIVHGGAKGVDTLAAAAAHRMGFVTIEVPAQWDTHGKSAGPIRNQEMIDRFSPDYCLAFTTGSRGTGHQIDACGKAGIPTRVITVAQAV